MHFEIMLWLFFRTVKKRAKPSSFLFIVYKAVFI